MSRVKKGSPRAHARHVKVLKLAKGYRGRSHNCYRIALSELKKLCATHTATVVTRNVISVPCGFSVSTLLFANTA